MVTLDESIRPTQLRVLIRHCKIYHPPEILLVLQLKYFTVIPSCTIVPNRTGSGMHHHCLTPACRVPFLAFPSAQSTAILAHNQLCCLCAPPPPSFCSQSADGPLCYWSRASPAAALAVSAAAQPGRHPCTPGGCVRPAGRGASLRYTDRSGTISYTHTNTRHVPSSNRTVVSDRVGRPCW